MSNNELEESLGRLRRALEMADSFIDDCDAADKGGAYWKLLDEVRDHFRHAYIAIQRMEDSLEDAPPAGTIQDAIALLEANGFIVGTKT
jgi:hypothetical protein